MPVCLYGVPDRWYDAWQSGTRFDAPLHDRKSVFPDRRHGLHVHDCVLSGVARLRLLRTHERSWNWRIVGTVPGQAAKETFPPSLAVDRR